MTITEIVVVIAIAMTITTAVVIQQNNWRDRLTVTTAAYDLALKIREAQLESLGVREDRLQTGGDKFSASYGVHASRGYTYGYYYFSDRNKNSKADYSAPSERITLKSVTFNDSPQTKGVLISAICGYSGASQVCHSPSLSVYQVYITFVRPDPNAVIKFYDNTSPTPILQTTTGPVVIRLSSAGGKRMEIKVELNGQVSVKPI
jgi:Tfp pilus assembly protein FimT